MNLLNKLYCVYFVFPPDDTPDFIYIGNNPQEYLGCSNLNGMFLLKKHAMNFARRLAKKKQVEEICDGTLQRTK